MTREDAEDHQRQWAREEQMMMIQEQDRTMDSISGTLNTLAQQAGLMGREILEHNECAFFSTYFLGGTDLADRMLDDLEVGVDRTDNKLSGAMRRMRKFIRQTEGMCLDFSLSNFACISDSDVWYWQKPNQGGV
jgi:syntaxin 6